jgi:hypothetical protein
LTVVKLSLTVDLSSFIWSSGTFSRFDLTSGEGSASPTYVEYWERSVRSQKNILDPYTVQHWSLAGEIEVITKLYSNQH